MRDLTIGKGTAGVGLLNKAFQVLDQFTTDRPMWTQAELGVATGVSKSTINRLVRYFCDKGYLIQPGGKGPYGLGPAAVDLGLRASAQFDIGTMARPLLERLAHDTGETALLAAYRPGEHRAVYVVQIPGPGEGLRVFQSVGSSISLHAGAVAKAILAYLPDEVRKDIIEGALEKLTETTITDPAVLAHDLAEIRTRGYAISREETYAGVYGIGAPIFGPGGSVVAGIAIAAPIFRMDSSTMLEHAQKVMKAAETVSARVGDEGAGQ
jgi:DNA-binding IclR family transcriptional regulator